MDWENSSHAQTSSEWYQATATHTGTLTVSPGMTQSPLNVQKSTVKGKSTLDYSEMDTNSNPGNTHSDPLFTGNVLPTQPRHTPPKPQVHRQTPPKLRQAYIRRAKGPQQYYPEKGKGRELDEYELEGFLGANVVQRVAYAENGTSDSNYTRRSNLRHLVNAMISQSALPRGDNDREQIHVTPSFATRNDSRSNQFIDMLEQTFGPDSPWGDGPKPEMVDFTSQNFVQV